MSGYGQFCPVSMAAEVFARRWTPLIIRELLCGSTRFNDIRRGMPTITASVLSRRLQELTVAGIVERFDTEDGASYHLTEAGEELRPVVEALGVWGRRWLPAEYEEEDLDPRLLVWDMHRNLRLEEIDERTVIELHFDDAPPDYRAYWLVVDREGADVCLTHPGGDIDVRLSGSTRTLADIWMGNTGWAAAVEADSLRVTGRPDACRALPKWLKLSMFAAIAPVARPGAAPVAVRGQ